MLLVAWEGLQVVGFELRPLGSGGGAPPASARGAAPPVDVATESAEPGGEEPGLVPARPGGLAVVEIDFEPSPGGPCAPCAVGDEWSEEGVILSFRSWTASSDRPWLVDARNYAPPGASVHAVGPALASERGLEVGILRLDFPSRPGRVTFTVYGPDLIRLFDIAARSDSGPLDPAAFTRSPLARYRPADRGVFRAERVTVASSLGVARITLDGWGPPGHLLFVDDVRIEP